MSLISISNLTFAYDGSYDNIFEDVSFQIDTDWKLGFTGRNGRGKTTFLKLLMGGYEYGGTISASVGFDYFPFEVRDKSENTIDIVCSLTNDFEFWELERELSLLELSPDALYRPFCSLSNGEQTKVLLAAFFLKDNNFPLIDEPTNHLDNSARMLVSRYLNSKKGFILVSHDREFLDNCIDHILSINKTNIEIQSGNFSSWWSNKQSSDNFELSENEKLKKDIKRMSAAAKRAASWSDKVEKSKHAPLKSGLSADTGYIGHKSAKMMKRSKSIEARKNAAAEQKSKLLKNVEEAGDLLIRPLEYHASKLIELDNVSLYYGENIVCRDIRFSINRGDRIALCGKNGSGKSSLLKLILGDDISYSGECRIGSNIITSYVPQDTSFLRGDLKSFANESGIDESLFKAILRKLGFSREQFDKDMGDYSGGQKKKVLIAKSLCERAHIYIWDEPLNFIDVLSRIQVESLIKTYAPTMLFVEHDGAFTGEIATQSVTL